MEDSTKNYGSALYSLVIVFFFWGFLPASNGIFIPFCKTHFNLTQFESQLIDFALYGGYFIGSLTLYYISQIGRIDFLNKVGYKNGIITGLLISAIGALEMGPAVNSGSFGLILTAFFFISIGCSLQQTAANPFVVAIGTPETGANRLNFCGAVNNIGGLLGPIVISIVLFGSATHIIAAAAVKISAINSMYYVLAALFVIVALFLWIKELPVVTSDEKIELSPKANKPLFVIFIAFCMILASDPLARFSYLSKSYIVYATLIIIVVTLIISFISAKRSPAGWCAMQYPQLILGMIAIFTYVGTEVTIQSNMGALLKTPQFGSFDSSKIAPYISLYWGSLMIGRWMGAIGAFNFSKLTKNILTVVVPFIAFGIVLGINYLTGVNIGNLYIYAISVTILIICFFAGKNKPVRTLIIFGLLGITFEVVGLLSTSRFAALALISGGLCCSIMWPSIFALSITGLKKYTSQGSAFLIMMILGGSIIPPVQGILADTSGMHLSYIVPVLGFAYITFFAWKVRIELFNQGINLGSY